MKMHHLRRTVAVQNYLDAHIFMEKKLLKKAPARENQVVGGKEKLTKSLRNFLDDVSTPSK